MGNPRFKALQEASFSGCGKNITLAEAKTPLEIFGEYTFNLDVMKKVLAKEVYESVLDAVSNRGRINPLFADTIALALKEWAISHGATHYTHWFQPMTGAAAEKHDAFLEVIPVSSLERKVVDKFSGKELIQGEPDASSFPSGGLRSTYEARGYTGWDPTTPPFLWHGGDGVTLCIPTVFFSWTGEVLDLKIPLLRSDEKINEAALRLLRLLGVPAGRVFSTLGLEQEYFVVDRALAVLRPDLLMLGKTVFGAHPPKGQELQDHYLGSVKDRILAYMLDFETEAFKLGIPVKTRHNEVAPAQHEVAPSFESASIALDHNVMLMELMRHIALHHGLSCLFHEKPFKGFNGSGKHSNWSLATDTGLNLLDPSDTPAGNLQFLIVLTAILHGVYTHAELLRAGIGSLSNDDRLGGHEAPPAIISVYLGSELEAVLATIEEKGFHSEERKKSTYDLGLPVIPPIRKDNTDRNRTSPFAFTGNKFEFRAVGASSNPAFSITILNAIVAESLNAIVDEIEEHLPKKVGHVELVKATLPVLRKFLKSSKNIRYSGDNYSEEWRKEAENRGLVNHEKAVTAFQSLKTSSTVQLFKGILTKGELESRFEIAHETYINNLKIEANLMIDIFNSQILPAAISYQKIIAESLVATKSILESSKGCISQLKHLKDLADLIEQGIDQAHGLKGALVKQYKGSISEKSVSFVEAVTHEMKALRSIGDQLEEIVDDKLWPLPKYRELLFVV